MKKDPDSTLVKKALRLKEINRLVIKSVVEWDVDNIGKLLDEFRNLKRDIRVSLLDTPVVRVNNKDANSVIRKIVDGSIFESDKIIKVLEGQLGEKFDVDTLDIDEKQPLGDELGDDLLYSWFDHYQYIEALYTIGSLTLGLSIPKTLETFVSEARQCYAFQQYNAVYSLCRTILEVAIRDVCKRKGLIKSRGNVSDISNYKVHELISGIFKGRLRERITETYNKASFLIHGHKTVRKDDAIVIFKDTLGVVQDIYSYNGLS